MTSDGRGRIALISLHTSPLDRPGRGDSGGMNVFVREISRGLAERGIAVDVFTRCSGRGVPQVEYLAPGARVIELHAGPCAPVPKEDVLGFVPAFEAELLDHVERDGGRYDLVQSHYWLSGLVGRSVARRWRTPLVALFHTLARVKNLSVRDGETPEPDARAAGEEIVARDATRVVVPTETEARYLAELYGTGPERARLAPPGVDTSRFLPMPKPEARRRIGVKEDAFLALVAGRLQPLKGPDLAIRALAAAGAGHGEAARRLELAVVGGGTPGSEHRERLRGVARSLGVADRVRFLDAVAHDEMPWIYSAADVVLMPSRSESFGLVALEAHACGRPVVASAVGGLRHIVVDGETGFLVAPGDAAALADRLLVIANDPALAGRLSEAALRRAAAFSWGSTVSRLHSVYRELRPDAFGGVPAQRA